MAEQIFKKETGWGGETSDNFIGEDEITVTITLNEYRNLVKEVASKEYDLQKEREKTSEANRKAQSYKDKLESLIEKLNGDDGDEDADQ